jgi:hypothetical protein
MVAFSYDKAMNTFQFHQLSYPPHLWLDLFRTNEKRIWTANQQPAWHSLLHLRAELRPLLSRSLHCSKADDSSSVEPWAMVSNRSDPHFWQVCLTSTPINYTQNTSWHERIKTSTAKNNIHQLYELVRFRPGIKDIWRVRMRLRYWIFRLNYQLIRLNGFTICQQRPKQWWTISVQLMRKPIGVSLWVEFWCWWFEI